MLSKGVGTRFLKHLCFLRDHTPKDEKIRQPCRKYETKKAESRRWSDGVPSISAFSGIFGFSFFHAAFYGGSVLVSEFLSGTLSRRLSKAKTSSCVWSNAVPRPTKKGGGLFQE